VGGFHVASFCGVYGLAAFGNFGNFGNFGTLRAQGTRGKAAHRAG
jgi:hypothetical protein